MPVGYWIREGPAAALEVLLPVPPVTDVAAVVVMGGITLPAR